MACFSPNQRGPLQRLRVTAWKPPRFVAVHPNFAQNQLVYVSYPKKDGDRITLAVARGRLSGGKIVDSKEIFVADAWETGGNLAGRVFFGADGSLYVTVGDRDRICCTGTEDNSLRMKAQSLENHVGKTLRLRDDGTVRRQSFCRTRGARRPRDLHFGHLNGYGLAVNPETGELWQAEIGFMGGDEVNISLPGSQLWVATGVDGAQLHGLARFRSALVSARHG